MSKRRGAAVIAMAVIMGLLALAAAAAPAAATPPSAIQLTFDKVSHLLTVTGPAA